MCRLTNTFSKCVGKNREGNGMRELNLDLGVIQQWLNSDRDESPQEMARILSTLTINGPFFAVGLKK